jgi:hypothetical protein
MNLPLYPFREILFNTPVAPLTSAAGTDMILPAQTLQAAIRRYRKKYERTNSFHDKEMIDRSLIMIPGGAVAGPSEI